MSFERENKAKEDWPLSFGVRVHFLKYLRDLEEGISFMKAKMKNQRKGH